MSDTKQTELKKAIEALNAEPLEPDFEAARDIIQIERKYYYGDRGNNKKGKEIREIIQAYANSKSVTVSQ